MPHNPPPDEPTAPHRPPPPPASPQEDEAWVEMVKRNETRAASPREAAERARDMARSLGPSDDMREAIDRSIEDNNRDINTTPLWRVCRLWAYYVQDATLQRLKAALAEQQETRDR